MEVGRDLKIKRSLSLYVPNRIVFKEGMRSALVRHFLFRFLLIGGGMRDVDLK